MYVIVKENDGKRVVLKQNRSAKIALFHSSEYCLVNAVNLAALAKLVYQKMPVCQQQLEGISFKERVDFSDDPAVAAKPFLVPYAGKKKSFSEGFTAICAEKSGPTLIDTQAFHYNDDEYNVFVFRGTQELCDFAADGFAPKIHFLAGEVHQGFHDNFQAVKATILQVLAKPGNRKCKTIITGHSLGAALATLTAAFLSTQFTSDPCGQVMLYTYGSPRVGTVQWVNAFASKFVHFRHRRVHDPITMLPPHHSSQKLPTLPVRIATMALGATGAALVAGEFIFRPGDDAEAFIHHGRGTLLREGPKGSWVTSTVLRKEFVVPDGVGWDSKQALLAREFVKNVTEFNQGIGPHAMSAYFGNLFHLLQESIRGWDHDPHVWAEVNRSNSKVEADFIESWKRDREKAVMDFSVRPAAPGSTSTPDSRQPISHEEKIAFYDDLIANAIQLKMDADLQANIWSRPDAKEALLKLILPGALSPEIEKELRFQLTETSAKVVKDTQLYVIRPFY